MALALTLAGGCVARVELPLPSFPDARFIIVAVQTNPSGPWTLIGLDQPEELSQLVGSSTMSVHAFAYRRTRAELAIPPGRTLPTTSVEDPEGRRLPVFSGHEAWIAGRWQPSQLDLDVRLPRAACIQYRTTNYDLSGEGDSDYLAHLPDGRIFYGVSRSNRNPPLRPRAFVVGPGAPPKEINAPMFEQPSATLVGGAAVVDGGVWLGLSTGGHASILRYDIASDQVSVVSTSTAPPPNLSVLLVGGRGPQGVELYWFARDAASVPELVRWTEQDHRLTPLNLAQAWRSPIPNCRGHTAVTVLRWLGPGRVEIQHESPVHYTLHDGQIDTRDPFRGLNTCRLRFAGVEASAEWALLETSSVESRPQLYHREEGAWVPGLRSAEWVPRALIQVDDELNISGDNGAVFRFRLIPSDGPLEIAKCPSIPTHATAVNFIEPLGRGLFVGGDTPDDAPATCAELSRVE